MSTQPQQTHNASRGKLKVVAIESPDDNRQRVTFTFSRPLTSLEIQGLATIIRQSIA